MNVKLTTKLLLYIRDGIRVLGPSIPHQFMHDLIVFFANFIVLID